MTPRLKAFALLLGLSACTTADINPMERQPKYLPYHQSEFFADGRAMRHPPQGTVPRQRSLTDPRLNAPHGPDGAWVSAVPVPMTMEMLRDGRKQFEIICATCHGLAGDGDSQVARNMAQRPAPSLHAVDTTPGRVYAITRDGYGLMPPFGGELSVEQRWAVVAYVQA
ncbi:MAG: c-type cytochrome, partial [Myxococcales bacterium]